MKLTFTFFVLTLSLFINAQTSITSVVATTNTAVAGTTYTNSLTIYNWGVAPNNTEVKVNGFTAGGIAYTYASYLTGTIKFRRVNNVNKTGNYSLVWAEIAPASFNMFPAYQNDMEPFFNGTFYNKGTDNLFDNISGGATGNNNNIERMDWILPTAFNTSTPDKFGFAVFERGAVGAHDPFKIAAILSIDAFGNPTSYSNKVNVLATNYADPGPVVNYRILKSLYPADLLDAGTGSQSRGGVIISLQNLGVAPNTPIYGYSLFANDLPALATSAQMVDYTNATYFPTNTGAAGGIDLVAVTGIYIDNSILPVHFTDFYAVENKGKVKLQWSVSNDINNDRYELEKSNDGVHFNYLHTQYPNSNINTANTYSFTDDITLLATDVIYYRVKQFDKDGSFYYSKTVSVRKEMKSTSLSLYPNPVQKNLFVNVTSFKKDIAVIKVFNSTGLLLNQQKTILQAGNNSLSINEVERLAKGNYILTITTDSGKFLTKKFIKQ